MNTWAMFDVGKEKIEVRVVLREVEECKVTYIRWYFTSTDLLALNFFFFFQYLSAYELC